MNELIIAGILLTIIGSLCIVCEIIENLDRLYAWLWNKQTVYYKWRARRRHKKGRW